MSFSAVHTIEDKDETKQKISKDNKRNGKIFIAIHRMPTYDLQDDFKEDWFRA